MRKLTTSLVILGGSDRKATELPPGGRNKHPLVGLKAVDVRFSGVPLIELVIERLRQTGGFDPIVIAGPERACREAGVAAPVIDTDRSFGENIRAGLEGVRRMRPDAPVGITTCDILPEVRDLEIQLEDFHAAWPCDLWYALIRAPRDPAKLGAFGWKPRYSVAPAPGEPPVEILPGHLCIVDPDALRLDFLYKLMSIGYRTRNRPIDSRRSAMVRQFVWRTLAHDLKHLATLRLPNLTWSIVVEGIKAARKLKQGTIAREQLERAVRSVFVKTRHRRRHPERGVRLPILDGLSLAADIDTVEEARAAGANRLEG